MTATQEVSGVEKRLFGQELGNRASELMGSVVDVLKEEPSVLSKLATACFRHNHGHAMNDISFVVERGDRKFEITHFDGRGVACSREKTLLIKVSDSKDVSKTSKIWLSAKYNHVRNNESYEDQTPFGGQITVRLGYNEPISDSEEAASLISGLLSPLFNK